MDLKVNMVLLLVVSIYTYTGLLDGCERICGEGGSHNFEVQGQLTS